MTKYHLLFKADFESVESLIFPVDHDWIFDFQCPSSLEKRNGVVVSQTALVEIPDSRSTANLCLKFPGSSKPASICVQSIKNTTRDSVLSADSGTFVPILALECRGAEPLAWHPSGYYLATAQDSHTEFNQVDLKTGDWCDFDEISDAAVGIYNVEWKITKSLK